MKGKVYTSLEHRSPRPRNHGCRITQFVYLGYDALALENEQLRITVLPGKGSDVIHFLYKPKDMDFMWASSPGLQPFGAVKSPNAKGQAFLDYYPGGWQEILPNFGDPCEYKNMTLGLHDEVSLLPWKYNIVEDDDECVSVELEVRCIRTPFRICKQLTLRPGLCLDITEEVHNDSEETMDCTWGHHPTFGSPFLDEACRVLVPPCKVKTQEEYVSQNSRLERGQDCDWPLVWSRKGEKVDLSRVAPKITRSHDMAYLYGFDKGWYGLFHEDRKLGFGMKWDSNIFPYLWFWQVYGGWSGYPWYGSSYNIGLEPCSSYPQSLTAAVRAGTQMRFAAGETIQTSLQAVVILDSNDFIRGASSDDATGVAKHLDRC
ncbi:MAG: aldose 1-epimerase [Terriglobales bacterium]